MSHFCDIVETLDREVLLFINGHNAPCIDQVFWAITQTYAWIPLYLLVVCLLFRCYRSSAWQLLLLIVLAVAVSDIISSGILKPLLHRPRPTHSPELSGRLRIFVKPDGAPYYGGRYGFPSSHATNSTVTAILTCFLLAPFLQRRWPLYLFMLFYVLVFCYTRPYFGVHYPTDILAGWCLGTVVSVPIALWARRKYIPLHYQGVPFTQRASEYCNYKF